MDDERDDYTGGGDHAARPPSRRPSQVRIAGAEPAARRAQELSQFQEEETTAQHRAVRRDQAGAAEPGGEELPWPRASDPWASDELPHWTEAPTGEVPAVLSGGQEPPAEDPWSTVPAPTWREDSGDWESPEESFSMFADDEPLGALDDRGRVDQPWAFDLESPPPGRPEERPVVEVNDYETGGARPPGARSEGGVTAYPSGQWPEVERTDEPTAMIPRVRRLDEEPPAAPPAPEAPPGRPEPVAEAEPPPFFDDEAAKATGFFDDEGVERPVEPEPASGGGQVFDFDAEMGATPAPPSPPAAVESGWEAVSVLFEEEGPPDERDVLQTPTASGPSATGMDPMGLDETGREFVAEQDQPAEPEPVAVGGASARVGVDEPPPSPPAPGPEDGRGRPASPPRLRKPQRPSGASSLRGRRRPGPGGNGRGGGQKGTERAGRNLPVAIATGVAAFALALICFAIGNVAALLLSLVVVTLAAAEAYGALRGAGYRPATLVGVVAVAALMAAAYTHGEAAEPLVAVVLVGTLFLWYITGVEHTDPVPAAGSTVLVYLWVGVFGSYAALLLDPGLFPDRHGIAFLLGAVIAGVAYDVGALAIGAWIGHRPLAPEVSPRKTWEGVFGGAVASIVLCLLVVRAIHPWGAGSALALGLVVAVVAPLGDLGESLLKRHLGVKDMGRFLPGHGGVLDRVDGLLFILPATFYLVRALNIG